ncbi:MAG: GTP-binding protein, partial [Erysipelotrichaceae bacterium]|nr:GTP-binding protein [Erysipelotrichaceae bacterium]
HHHHHHHGDEDDDHDADEIFDSYGYETSRQYDVREIEEILKQLDDRERFGFILRAKGIVAGKDGSWIHFDYVPEEISVRSGSAISRGRFCVIGAEMKFDALEELFGGQAS